MSHVTLISRTYTHINSCDAYSGVLHMYYRVVSQMWMSHVTNENEACHTRGGRNTNASCHTYMDIKESCHIYYWVMSHMHTNHVTHGLEYGMPSISRLLKIKGLFCKRALQKRRYSAKSGPMCKRVMSYKWLSKRRICTHAHICTHTCTHTHTQTQPHTNTYIHTRIYTHTDTYRHT